MYKLLFCFVSWDVKIYTTHYSCIHYNMDTPRSMTRLICQCIAARYALQKT